MIEKANIGLLLADFEPVEPSPATQEFLELRRLTSENLAQAMGLNRAVIRVNPGWGKAGWESSDHLSEETRERIRRAAERFGSTAMTGLLYGLMTHERFRGCAKPRIRLRMLVKAGAHVGYQQLNPDNSIHSYEWFEEN